MYNICTIYYIYTHITFFFFLAQEGIIYWGLTICLFLCCLAPVSRPCIESFQFFLLGSQLSTYPNTSLLVSHTLSYYAPTLTLISLGSGSRQLGRAPMPWVATKLVKLVTPQGDPKNKLKSHLASIETCSLLSPCPRCNSLCGSSWQPFLSWSYNRVLIFFCTSLSYVVMCPGKNFFFIVVPLQLPHLFPVAFPRPATPQSIPTPLSVPMSPLLMFPFPSFPVIPLPTPVWSLSVCYVHVSGSILLICLFC